MKRVIAITIAVTTLAACTTGNGHGDADPTSPSTSESHRPQSSKKASDSGRIKVIETGFTVDDETSGSTDVLTAVRVENTSKTDMLNYADVELTWIDDAGVEEDPRHTGTEIMSIAPGESAVVGGLQSIGLDPVKLKAKVTGTTWYRMAEIKDLDADPRIKQGDSKINVTDDRVNAEVTFDTRYDYEHDLNLNAFLVMYDSKGALLGASQNADGITLSPHTTGKHGIQLQFSHSDWINGAKPAASRVIVSWGFKMISGSN